MIAPRAGGSRADRPLLRWHDQAPRDEHGYPILKSGQGRTPSQLRQTARDLALLLAGALVMLGTWLIARRP